MTDEQKLKQEAREMVMKAPWNRIPDDSARKLCGVDDGATVCIRPVGHPPGHKAKSGRVWL